MYNSSYNQEDHNTLYKLSSTEDALVQCSSLSDYKLSYALNLYVIVDKGYYRWTFRNLHNRVRISEETESENKFSEN